jgi:hypothetical protein
MRMLLLSFALLSSSAAAFAVPQASRPVHDALGRPIRLSLVNLSGKSRQLVLREGILNLPPGQRVDVDSKLGATLDIISEMDSTVHLHFVVENNQGALIIPVS